MKYLEYIMAKAAYRSFRRWLHLTVRANITLFGSRIPTFDLVLSWERSARWIPRGQATFNSKTDVCFLDLNVLALYFGQDIGNGDV